MEIIEIADKVADITNALFVSTTKEQIESIFKKYEIIDPFDKIALLRKTMQVEDISNIQEEITPEEEYEDEVKIFIEASWRFLI